MKKNLQLLTRILILTGFLLLLLYIVYTALNYFLFQPPSNTPQAGRRQAEETVKVPEKDFLYEEVHPVFVSGKQLYGITGLHSGDIAITADSLLLLYEKGKSIPQVTALENPALCLTEGPDGKIYLGVQDHIEIYSAEGIQIDEWTTIDEASVLTSIAVNNHFVFAADAGTKQIIVFDHQGKLIRFIDRYNDSEPGFLIPGLHFECAVDPDGSLWVTDPGRHKVLNITTEGKLISGFGSFGTNPEQFAGCCNPVAIALTPDQTIAAFEKGLLRLKLYTSDGFFIGLAVDPFEFHRSITAPDIAFSISGEILLLDNNRKMIRSFIKKEPGA